MGKSATPNSLYSVEVIRFSISIAESINIYMATHKCSKSLRPRGLAVRSIAGFTLIEVVIIIVVLGILSTIAIGKYQDFSLDAKRSACRAALGGLRGGLSTWQSQNIVKRGAATYPPIDTLRTIGRVMEQRIPPNPFQANAPDSIVTGVTKGVVVGTRGGWAYKATTGEIWANTNTVLESASGCSGSSTTVGENSW